MGTLAWAERGGGRLNLAESFTLVLQAVQDQIVQAGRGLLRQLGLRSGQVSWQGLELPQGPLAEAATALCRQCSSPALLHHCWRSYAWGTLLARRDDVRFQPELFYLACMLHDLGLTDHAPPTRESPCFAVTGARAARHFLLQRGVDPGQAEAVAQAICLHLNVKVPLRHGPEAYLLRQATALDVIGARLSELDREARARVLELYPREGMTPELASIFGRPPVRGPRTRVDLLCRCGFLAMMRACPLER